jgi:hypothetical protein
LALPLLTWGAAPRAPCDMPPRHVRDSPPIAQHELGGPRPATRSEGSHFAPTSGDFGVSAAQGEPVPSSCAYCAICCVGAALFDWAAHLAAPGPAQVEYPAQGSVACAQPFDGPERTPSTF